MEESRQFARIAIIGTGLIGASVGLATLDRDVAREVVGFDQDHSRARDALSMGAVTEASESLSEAVRGADLVILCGPVGEIPGMFQQAMPDLTPGAVVTDVGSAKTKIVSDVSKRCPPEISFVGGHPVAGSEQEGLGAASKDLFDGAYWILTPTQHSDPKAYQRLVRFLGALGARVISLDPQRHDEAVALSSHLPQLISTNLMAFAAEVSSGDDSVPLFAAGGFRDMTRVAASPSEMWIDIIRDNQDALTRMTQGFLRTMSASYEQMAGGRWEELQESFSTARSARRSLPSKPGIEEEALVEIRVRVPDKPGVLAEIATTVGEAGVNIEDIDIVHSLEGGRGTIHLVVNGEEPARRARAAIRARDLPAEIQEP